MSEPETVRLPSIFTSSRNSASPSMVMSPRTKSASRTVISPIFMALPVEEIIISGSYSFPLIISLPSMVTSPRRVAPLASTASPRRTDACTALACNVPPATMSPFASRLSVRMAPATSRSSSIRAEPETVSVSVTMPAATLRAPEKVTSLRT